MDKKRKRKFWIANIAITLIPVIGAVFGVVFYFTQNMYFIYACGAMFMIYFVFNKPFKAIEAKYRKDVETDEFGRNKDHGTFEQLTKEERRRIELEQVAEDERILNSTELYKMTKKGCENPETDMEKLIGLQPVKDKTMEMVARMQFELEKSGVDPRKKKKNKKKNKDDNKSNAMSGRHMVFYGNPGTGKTTIARILTGFLYKYGYIDENKCVEVDGNFLKEGTSTARKTELVIRQALGGVLFIDEAYALMEGNQATGAEAIATLIKQMEDYRGRFILILAGYTRNMQQLLAANPGFESRIQEYLNFPDYTIPELEQIFETMAQEKGYEVDPSAYPLFDTRLRNEMGLRSFGNARTVRSILDECIGKHSVNWVNQLLSPKDKLRIRDIDINTELQRKGMI